MPIVMDNNEEETVSMRNQVQRPQKLVEERPLATTERALITRFLDLHRDYHELLCRVEAVLERQHRATGERQFFGDVCELIQFRQLFFTTIDRFLAPSLLVTYQAMVLDDHHHRRVFSREDLRSLSRQDLHAGQLIETLRYGDSGLVLRRYYSIQDRRLYWDKHEVTNQGKTVPWFDGLMLIQAVLQTHSVWLDYRLLKIQDYI